MGLLTFSINVTLDGCVDHQEGIADDETHAFFTRLMDESGAMLWGRVTYEMMESYWPAVARGDVAAPSAMREWATKLEAKPKHVVSSTRKDFPWTNSYHIAGDLRTGVQKLKDEAPSGVLLGSSNLATELDRLDLIDDYKFLVHPRITGHGPTLYQAGYPAHDGLSWSRPTRSATAQSPCTTGAPVDRGGSLRKISANKGEAEATSLKPKSTPCREPHGRRTFSPLNGPVQCLIASERSLLWSRELRPPRVCTFRILAPARSPGRRLFSLSPSVR